ncbi:glycosyl transferase family 90-domain-containing protein [Mycena maculata]|uniref:Glycosyl transferase family 90-domain-containing protein n=1 Tax=Mycena maculata TaxID=230809 RepID=A0AAD7JSC3_9AGAR|nr:glycosyl transferase family 90-domain-containing protein [Mycena maculata]
MRTRRERGLLLASAITTVYLVSSYFNTILPQVPPSSLQVPVDWHTFRDDGLLEFNPEGNHPIFELIRRAEVAWKDKLDRASTTFPQAVSEYRRRYKRDPPKGFDAWWNYVRNHAVQLPDEYDQIYADLEPFWGIELRDLLAITSELEVKADSFALGKTANSKLHVVNASFAPGLSPELVDHYLMGAKHAINFLDDIDELLPPFRAVFSPYDVPSRLSDHFVKDAARRASAEKQYIRRKDLPKVDRIGWTSACAPNSPGRNTSINIDSDTPQKTRKTFIHDHKLAMDPCLHPRHFWQHAQFIWDGEGPTPEQDLAPLFSYSSTTVHHDICVPMPYLWVADTHDPEWDDKADGRLSWRGTATGISQWGRSAGIGMRLESSLRIRLVQLANDLKGAVSILSPVKSETEPLGEPIDVPKSTLNPGIMDVGFTDGFMMCDPALCEYLRKTMPWREYQNLEQAGQYKYVMDVDGNGWSGRFERLMMSKSLVFKATLYTEWYNDRIAPWVHYIPVQLDLSDLHDALVFFRGDETGAGAHEDLARKIAAAGRVWSKTFWRKEDMHAYFYRLILEYARLMSEDRDAMSYREDR